jgi:hypothetical protein
MANQSNPVDEFEEFASLENYSVDELIDLKQRVGQRGEPKRWRFMGVILEDWFLAAQVANNPPAQQAGEAVFVSRPDGKVSLFLFF